MKDLFLDCQLFVSARSPFARRIRLTFLEHDIRHTEKIVDVLTPNQEVMQHNPLGRVPTVVLKSGDVLFESNLILQLFYSDNESSFFPKKSRLELFRWMALSTGLMDKSIEYFFEAQRPVEQRDKAWLDEISLTVQNSLAVIDTRLSTQEYLVENRLTQADLDLGAALDYLSLRISNDWKQSFIYARKYLDRLHARPSFEKTTPPSPT